MAGSYLHVNLLTSCKCMFELRKPACFIVFTDSCKKFKQKNCLTEPCALPCPYLIILMHNPKKTRQTVVLKRTVAPCAIHQQPYLVPLSTIPKHHQHNALFFPVYLQVGRKNEMNSAFILFICVRNSKGSSTGVLGALAVKQIPATG